jgi:hypothetical protein
MATCGYICPKCEGKGYLDDGTICDWCKGGDSGEESDFKKEQQEDRSKTSEISSPQMSTDR